jgi:hypothetical protein
LEVAEELAEPLEDLQNMNYYYKWGRKEAYNHQLEEDRAAAGSTATA